ncbi:hypothetical protein V7S43_016607 [Phytophthora oleae]|uniref:PX domain-containing protein n=1 Tax=Phytophthora oleae TaxID=2107226 RepID=A0ABD3EX17_9STRA
MSAEEMHLTPLTDKNGRPEADEDARTESSEGSNAQSQWTPEAGESEDEFEDAMEPPSSTSGMLLTFEGAAPPLSGVYHDAVEATDEQVLAVIVSTGSEGSEGRQSTIQEEEEQDEEKENEMEDEVVAVVEAVVEKVAAGVCEEIDEEKVNVSGEDIAGIQVEETVAETLDEDVKDLEEDVDEEEGTIIGKEKREAVKDTAVEERPETSDETEQAVAEMEVENGVPEAPEVLASEQAVEGVLDGESASEENITAEPGIEEEAAEFVPEPDTTGDNADATEDTTPETPAVVVEPVEAEKLRNGAVQGTVEETAAPVSNLVETDPVGDESVADTVAEQPVMDHEAQKDEDAAVEAVVVNVVESEDTEAAAEEELVDEDPIAALAEQEPAEVPNEASTEEKALTTHSAEIASAEVEEVVAQVTNELVEAVLDKAEGAEEENFEEKPAPDSVSKEVATGEKTPKADDIVLEKDSEDNNVEAEGKKNSAQAEAGNASGIAPASAVKEVRDSNRKSSDDQPYRGVLLGLLPRLEPSSGATTTTTIEPFVLSSEGNEMMEVHLPPQRWTYEVYGFSIEDRVVYYHIHRSDRRTGIREPPVLKRYTDFRELQIQLLDTCLHAAADMPRIPRPHLGTVFRGYKSKKTIEIRETAFRALLRYISQYPALHGSAVFERFITTTRASTGAGWM